MRADKHIYKHGCSSQTIPFEDQTLQISFSTGAITTIDNRRGIFSYPKLDTGHPEKFKELLYEMFKYYVDRKAMVKYFWQCIGCAMIPPQIFEYRLVLYGQKPNMNGARYLYRLVTEMNRDNKKVKIETRPPDKVHSDDEIHSNIILPLNNPDVMSMNNPKGVPVYAFDSAIRCELGSIRYWAIRGLSSVIKAGYISIPDEIRDTISDYYRTIDLVGEFIRQCTILHDGDSGLKINVSLMELYASYKAWVGDNKCTHTGFTFRDEIKNKGFVVRRFKNRNCCFGLSLKREYVL